MVLSMLLTAALMTPLTDAVAEIQSASPAVDSNGLLGIVTKHFAAQAIAREQSTIGALLQAWDETRQRPDVDVDDVAAALALRRDAVRSLDVVYHASLFIDPLAAGPLRSDLQVGGGRTWWGRWTRTPAAVRRVVAPDLRTLLDESPAWDLVAAGCDERGTWSLRGDGVLAVPVHEQCDGGQVLGLEGSWLGAGMLTTMAQRGLAVVPSHDVADLLRSLPPGAAVVEPDGGLIRLRIGWTSPLFAWLDPDDDLAVRRVVRRWQEGEVEMELETTPSAWMPSARGVAVPTRIHIVQRIVGGGQAPMMELNLRAIWLQVGGSVDPSMVRPP
jgi:hypothetical protein